MFPIFNRYILSLAENVAWCETKMKLQPILTYTSAMCVRVSHQQVNHVGLMLGLFYTLTTYGLANAKTRKIQLAVFLFFASVLSLLGAVGTMTRMSNNHLKLLWGFSTNAILLMYYAAPLSTVYLVIKTRSAASLHAPLVIMQCVNGALWFGYGMAISDP